MPLAPAIREARHDAGCAVFIPVISALLSGSSRGSSQRHAHPPAARSTSVDKTPRLKLSCSWSLNEAQVAALVASHHRNALTSHCG
jgi:hypothetical protein